jgi:hypothetical protein
MMIAALLVFIFAQSAIQGATAPATPEKGEIRGRVTDRETGMPLARAVVHLFGPDSKGHATAATDDRGAFRFAALAPGRYSGMIEPGPFRGTHSSRDLTTADGRAQPIVLSKDELREINVTLPRTLVLNVRVLDQWGEPLAGLQIGLRPHDKQQLGIMVRMMASQRTTDDKGQLRIFGLEPGRYVVCAEPNTLGGFGGGPHTNRRDRLLRTCYPTAASEADAEPIRVERSGGGELEIRMRQGRTFAIAGRVVDASGAPPVGAHVGLTQYIANGSSGSGGAKIEPDGRFRIQNVHPGDYAIEASVGGPDRPEQRRDYEAAFVPVRIDTSDVEDLLVVMKHGVNVEGRLTLEDPTQTLSQPPGSGLYVAARLAEDRVAGSGSTRSTIARADRTFTLERLFGRRFLHVQNVPRGWYVKSIRYGGRDIIDQLVEFKAGRDAPAVEIILSNRGAVVTGRAVDESGAPVPRAHVLMLRMGKDGFPMLLSESTRTATAGTFRFAPVRGGEYAIVALPAASEYPQAGEWDRLARLVELGERVTLSELDERLVDLRVVTEKR